MELRIGITTSYSDETQRLHRTYVRAVERTGALPIVVPVLESTRARQALVDLLDGLIVPGGPAVTDGLIGTLPADLDDTDPVRVASDRALLNAFLATNKPILGICYGMQLLNALAGGTIYADVERQRPGTSGHSEKRGADTHPIALAPGSRLHAILGRDRVDVNTRHIQAVAEVGDGYAVSATAPDGVVEAIEAEHGRVIGVQFHPEKMGAIMDPLFAAFIADAQKRKDLPVETTY